MTRRSPAGSQKIPIFAHDGTCGGGNVPGEECQVVTFLWQMYFRQKKTIFLFLNRTKIISKIALDLEEKLHKK
jgi:hypothetical protein